jgi:hypothetical protein
VGHASAVPDNGTRGADSADAGGGTAPLGAEEILENRLKSPGGRWGSLASIGFLSVSE